MTPSSPAPSNRRNQSAAVVRSRVAGVRCNGGSVLARTDSRRARRSPNGVIRRSRSPSQSRSKNTTEAGISPASSFTREAAGCSRSWSASKSRPPSRAMTSSPSSTHCDGSWAFSGSRTSGKYRFSGFSSRLWMKISSPSRKMSVRKPSHLGSKIHPSPGGSSLTRFASMGSIGGLTGRSITTGGTMALATRHLPPRVYHPLYRRSPIRRVFPAPVLHRCLVTHDASGLRVCLQLAPGVLRDVPEMAEHEGSPDIGDGRAERLPSAHRTGEILDVCRGVGIIASEIQTIRDGRLPRLANDLALHVVVHIAVAIQHDRSVGAQHLRPAPAPERLRSVAALSLPDQRFAIGELEDDFLRVREFPVIVEVISSPRGADA